MKSVTRFPSLLRPLRPFSSGRPAGDCAALRRSAIRRPVTLKPRSVLRNSCSLIGSVTRPITRFGGDYKGFGVYTFLELNPPPSPLPSFQILLAMENELAELSLEYLKINDFIYVSGILGSYPKVDGCGKLRIIHKVLAKELTYVRRCDRKQTCERPERSETEECTTQISSKWDEDVVSRNRLDLWQLFFANPSEWWDNRSRRLSSGTPDFRHKDTRECLWLDPKDPPWVREQLQLYDSKMSEGQQMNFGGKSSYHEWKLKDFM